LTLATENSTTIVKSLAETIQEKILIPHEQRFQQIELRLQKIQKSICLYAAGLAVTSVLALALAVYNFLH